MNVTILRRKLFSEEISHKKATKAYRGGKCLLYVPT